MKLGSPTFGALQKIGDEHFVPGLPQKMATGSMDILGGRLIFSYSPGYTCELEMVNRAV